MNQAARRTITPAHESAAIARAQGVSASIRAHLRAHPGATSRAVAAGIGQPQPLVYNHLAQMVYTGLVVGIGAGASRTFSLGRLPEFEPGRRKPRAPRPRKTPLPTSKGAQIERVRAASIASRAPGSAAGDAETIEAFRARGGRVQVLASVPYVPAIARPVGWKT